MRTFQVICFIFLLLPGLLAAQPAGKAIPVERLPSNMDEFLILRNALAGEPEGAAAIFVTAMLVYVRDPELGTDMFTVALDSSQLIEKHGGYKGFAPNSGVMSYLENYLAPKPYLAASYISGTGPENGYILPDPPLSVDVSRNRYSEQTNGDIKVFIACSGADSPRPVILRRNNRGLWKAVNVNSLFVGIRPPAAVTDDDL